MASVDGDLCNAAAEAALKTTVAAAVSSVSSASFQASDVHSVAVSTCPSSRRLAEARRLLAQATQQTTLTYTLQVVNAQQAAAVRDEIVANKASFGTAFSTQIASNLPSVTVSNLTVADPVATTAMVSATALPVTGGASAPMLFFASVAAAASFWFL